MSPMKYYDYFQVSGFPRVSGDEPEADGISGHDGVFSPRERG